MENFKNKQKLQIRAKKRFGQNFLVNSKVKQRIFTIIADLVQEKKPQFLLEIGPGQGDMTEKLLELNLPLLCYEIDSEAVAFLKTKFSNYLEKQLILEQADALKKLKLTQNLTNDNIQEKNISFLNAPFLQNCLLFSSLPYNVASRILVELGLQNPQICFVVIVQKEVAKKILQTQKLTFFGAWLNLFWDLKILFEIDASSFLPQPKVTSSLLVGRAKNLQSDQKQQEFSKNYENRLILNQILKQLFARPKKTLLNNLLDLKINHQNLFNQKTQVQEWLSIQAYQTQSRLNWQNYQKLLTSLWQKAIDSKIV